MPNKDLPYKQDLPPKGGYPKVQVSRIPTYTPTGWKVGLFALLTVPVAFLHHGWRKHVIRYEQLSDDEARVCLEPLLTAESDRLVLWQMRRNREEENNLMKNVPGWKTGTWFGEPVFKTNANFDKWVWPKFQDLYAHTRERDMKQAMNEGQRYI